MDILLILCFVTFIYGLMIKLGRVFQVIVESFRESNIICLYFHWIYISVELSEKVILFAVTLRSFLFREIYIVDHLRNLILSVDNLIMLSVDYFLMFI